MRTSPKSNPLSLSLSAKMFLLALAGSAALAVIILIFSSSTAATSTGAAPDLAISLAGEMGTGILAPGETRWYKFSPSGPGQAGHVEQSLTMFFTPGAGSQARHVSFQLFEGADQAANFGAGQIVSRDNNPRSGELFWTGWLFEQQSYYIQLVNSNAEPVDYWLLTDDVISYPVDGLVDPPPVTESATQPVAPPGGSSPQTAVPLQPQRNQGQLKPGEARWYSFSVADSDDEFFEEAALTLFATPNNGQQIQNFTFELFTAEEVQRWGADGHTALNNVGAGSLTARDDDPLTGERFWTGWLVERNLYYIRVQNGTNFVMDYSLFAGDVYNPQLGSD